MQKREKKLYVVINPVSYATIGEKRAGPAFSQLFRSNWLCPQEQKLQTKILRHAPYLVKFAQYLVKPTQHDITTQKLISQGYLSQLRFKHT